MSYDPCGTQRLDGDELIRRINQALGLKAPNDLRSLLDCVKINNVFMANRREDKTGQSFYSELDIQDVEGFSLHGVNLSTSIAYARSLVLNHESATDTNKEKALANLANVNSYPDLLNLMVNTRNRFEEARSLSHD